MANRCPRVLVTRSPQQSSELADRLRALGLDAILIPAIEFTEPTSFAALDAALTHLDSFHWLLFTSANAVEVFHRRLDSLQIRVPHVSILRRGIGSPQIAAIGPSTARALQAIGLKPDLIPPQAVAESLTEALLPHARQPDRSPTRFLLIRAESIGDAPPRELLPETLRAAGADVTVAPAYRTLIPAASIPAIREIFGSPNSSINESEVEKAGRESEPASRYPEASASGLMTASGERGFSPWGMPSEAPPPTPIDAITFTSSSTVHNLLALCAAAGVTLPPGALRISIGPITSQTLRDAGYPPHAEAAEATVPALAEAVLNALNRTTPA